MSKFIIVILLILVLILGSCSAKLPQKGDRVRIGEMAGLATIFHDGNITDVSQGLICLNCTGSISVVGGEAKQIYQDYPFDICIGTGSIASLVWLK